MRAGFRSWPLRVGLLVAALTLVAPAAAAQVDAVGSGVEEATDLLNRDVVGSDSRAAGSEVQPAAQSGEALKGTFVLTPGECQEGDDPSGTYFKMIQPGGSDSGPYVENGDSPCEDQSATPLEPGSDGGLINLTFQPHPDPAFEGGNGINDRITLPARFFGSGFAVGTQSPDPQNGEDAPEPSIEHDGSGNLTGQTAAFVVAYNGAWYNQGAPKPNGSTPGITTDGVSGTYDPDTGAFVIEWVSTIDGGAFNNFSGFWHLEGTFESSGTSASSAGPGTVETDDTQAGAQQADENDATTGTDDDTTTSASGRSGGRLAETGPPIPPIVSLVLLAAAALGVRARRRPASAR